MSISAFHTVLVIGNNPEELMKKYSTDIKVDKYVKYKRADASKLRKSVVKIYKSILDNESCTDLNKEDIKKLYFHYNEMSDFDYYKELTKGCIFEDNSLDAFSEENPDGKYSSYNKDYKNNKFSIPFTLIDDNNTEVYQAKVKDVDWDKIHMANTFPYVRAWELVMEHDDIHSDEEQQIYDNMCNHIDYFNNFSSKEEYVAHSCSFWMFAVLDSNGWIGLDNSISDKEWVATFYNKFVKDLPSETLLTIIEYREPF